VYCVYLVVSGHLCVSTEQARIFLRYRCFFVIVTDGRVLSCLGGFNFDILWSVPLLFYRNDVFCAFYQFSCCGVIYYYSCCDVVLCCVENELRLFQLFVIKSCD
jgi:hypothetical protein